VSSKVVLLVTFLHLLGVVEKILQHQNSRAVGFVVSSSVEFALESTNLELETDGSK